MNSKSLALFSLLSLALGVTACDNTASDNTTDEKVQKISNKASEEGALKPSSKVSKDATELEKTSAKIESANQETETVAQVKPVKETSNQAPREENAGASKRTDVRTKPLQDVTVLDSQQISDLLRNKFPSANIQHIAPSEIDGLYSFVLQGDLYYISNNGKYLIKGQVLDISTPKVRNLSSERMAEIQKKESPMRMKEINSLDESDMVVFKAPNEKHVITIFTDVDCGFCQKMHRERQNYLDLGITLRYLAFPRAGLDSKSAAKLEGIWCAADQQTAMTEAKIQNKYRTGNCQTPFKEHMALVRKFGLNGTPGIILENGDLIGGYLPAEVLNRRLTELSSEQEKVANR